MMKYLLDTNICIHLFQNKFGIKEKIREVGLHNCAISQLTVAELLVGVEYTLQKTGRDHHQQLDLFISQVEVFPIDESIEYAAKEMARLQLAGTPANDMIDVLIASTAVVNNMIMITENVRHFKNISGIQLENWIERTTK